MKSKCTDYYKKVRKTWGELNPATRVLKSKKIYSRKEKYKNAEHN